MYSARYVGTKLNVRQNHSAKPRQYCRTPVCILIYSWSFLAPVDSHWFSQQQVMAEQSGIDDTDYEWQPPSEAEMKVIQARRDRNDKISKLMGDYLLKGYKMLGATCPECTTILLQTKQGQDYCVACRELDSDADKDNPATSVAAAMSQFEEHQRSGKVNDEDAGGSRASEPVAPSSAEAAVEISLPSAPQVHDDLAESSETLPRLTRDSMEGYLLQLRDSFAGSSRATLPDSSAGSSRTILLEQVDTKEPLQQLADMKTMALPTDDTQDCFATLTKKIKWATTELEKTTSLEHSIQLCNMIKAGAEALKALKDLVGS